MTAPVWGQEYNALRSSSVVAQGLEELRRGGQISKGLRGDEDILKVGALGKTTS